KPPPILIGSPPAAALPLAPAEAGADAALDAADEAPGDGLLQATTRTIALARTKALRIKTLRVMTAPPIRRRPFRGTLTTLRRGVDHRRDLRRLAVAKLSRTTPKMTRPARTWRIMVTDQQPSTDRPRIAVTLAVAAD